MAKHQSPHKRQRKQKTVVPKPGQPGYLTPTQLRNARKRRAKQQLKKQQHQAADPSLEYIHNPQQAPVVQTARRFFRTKVAHFRVACCNLTGWRTVCKLAVRCNEAGLLQIGLFVRNSHTVVDIADCPSHHPGINAAVAVLQQTARALCLSAYNDETGRGCLRHVMVAVERATGKVQITLIWNGRRMDDTNALLNRFCKALIAKGTAADNGEQQSNSFRLHSLWVHYNSSWKHANAIIDTTTTTDDDAWEKLHGPDHVTEYLSTVYCPTPIPLYFPPTVFRQANLTAFESIVQEIRNYVAAIAMAPVCMELYGGVGTIGLHVADLCQSLSCSDANPHNQACFERSAAVLQQQLHDKNNTTTYICYQSKSATAMAETYPERLLSADLIIVDPPRKGLEETVAAALARPKTTDNNGVQHLVYVSCGFDAFQRDYDVLTVTGGWKLQRAAGYILFPGSDAIETLAFFTR